MPTKPIPNDVKATDSKHKLRFGIPSLDWLFERNKNERRDRGIQIPDVKPTVTGTTSLSLIGKSGTGKSILGLHLASRYLADYTRENKQPPIVLYVSTDLKFTQAQKTWDDFKLNSPNTRAVPFDDDVWKAEGLQALTIQLDEHKLTSGIANNKPKLFAALLSEKTADIMKLKDVKTQKDVETLTEQSVFFVDLASQQSGDDWAYLMRLVEQLPTNSEAKHLIIVDALEGLEVLAGSTDRFGRIRSRRAQVAELLRRSGNKCHVAFILEEGDDDHVPPEEFVTDTVIRLVAEKQPDYTHRKVEVLKCRGSQHARGKHRYFIRKGTDVENEDKQHPPDDPKNKNAYLYIAHSLDFLAHTLEFRAKEINKTTITSGPKEKPATLHTPILPRILPGNGLPCRKITVLTGDEATYKSRFGHAFLAGGLNTTTRVKTAEEKARTTAISKETAEEKAETTAMPKEPAENGMNKLEILAENDDMLVCITTRKESLSELAKKLKWHLLTYSSHEWVDGSLIDESIQSSLIVRQLEARILDSATMMMVIERSVNEGLSKAKKRNIPNHRVRVLIDDWSVMKASYPALAKDPLFLPYLARFLKEMEVTTLIIETTEGKPAKIFEDKEERQLRSMADHHLLTWHVDFYGQSRVAIAAVPPMMDEMPNVVAELRPPARHQLTSQERITPELQERLWADRHFELYQDLETGHAKPVGLEVHLFSAAKGFDEYRDAENPLFDNLFTPSPSNHPPNQPVSGPDHVLCGHRREDYPGMRAYSSLHGDIRSDHTIVLQVDEYWQPPGAEMSGDDGNVEKIGGATYLHQPVLTKASLKPIEEHDPYLVFQSGDEFNHELLSQKDEFTGKLKRVCKKDFFHPPGYGSGWAKLFSHRRLVPYHWDFGYLMVNRTVYESVEAEFRKWDKKDGTHPAKDWILHVKESISPSGRPPKNATWDQFLDGCRWIAARHGPDMRPFDMDMLSPQTFACLVLEIWASEMCKGGFNIKLNNDRFPKQRTFKSNGTASKSNGTALTGLLVADDDKKALFETWKMLSTVLRPQEFVKDGVLVHREGSDNCVAQRQWYVTSSSHPWNQSGNFIPVRLPGKFSTRGDWFLTVGRESQSQLLGERAIDLLSTRRANMIRLEKGLGLPVRDLFHPEIESGKSKAFAANLNDEYHTALRKPAGSEQAFWSYNAFRQLGAPLNQTAPDTFRWLWRSQISDYLECDRIWERWLARFLLASRNWKDAKNPDFIKMVESLSFVLKRAGQTKSHEK